ncbi:sigma-70 family RNA polymerase sigma factor [Jiangella asiatica]|uniref:Sigma-70 family RNA polymerase sigma factor n=2 Tax=Jiangella asiatica TaxID=2530372 RepID=A0A4R5DBC3_9ACTN|nr:sigma-70 family RNA polymerase sigma factor [Jiangella asiatica]
MLLGMAYRMLGSTGDAEDVIQDAYLRWRSVDRDEVTEPRRYLSRMVARLALDRLRERRDRERYVGPWLPEPVITAVLPAPAPPNDPQETAEQRDTLSVATLYLMERLNPVERAVFVLRSAFELPYDEIAGIVDRTPEHCRQLHRRAVARLADDRQRFEPSRREHAVLLERFLSAARDGDLARLRALLHDDVVAWTDGGGKAKAARNPVLGADRVARFFAGIHSRNRPAIVLLELNASPAALLGLSTPQAVTFTVVDGRISGLFVVANPDKLARLPLLASVT